jgi:hypothetical protein
MLDGGVRSFAGPPYSYDVFVSYSHGDPKGIGKTPLATWTHRLIDELEQDIHSTTTEFDQLALWNDRQADPTLKLTDTIKELVSRSALLLIVMSPRYLASAWCKDELQWFEEELRRRDHGEGCTLVVRALPTEEEHWPASLKDGRGNSVIGFWFHRRPAQEGVRAFGWPDPQSTDRAFFDVLSSLSTTVQRRLRKIKEREALRERVAKRDSLSAGKSTVYLHARQSDVEIWHRIRQQLIDNGYNVLPDSLVQETGGLSGLPLAQELRRRRAKSYLDCDALLILRSQEGSWIDNELKSVGFGELRDLYAFCQKRLPRAVLDFVNDGAMHCDELNIKGFSAEGDWLSQFANWLKSDHTGETGSTESAVPLNT